jgi:hypothetical protein
MHAGWAVKHPWSITCTACLACCLLDTVSSFLYPIFKEISKFPFSTLLSCLVNYYQQWRWSAGRYIGMHMHYVCTRCVRTYQHPADPIGEFATKPSYDPYPSFSFNLHRRLRKFFFKKKPTGINSDRMAQKEMTPGRGFTRWELGKGWRSIAVTMRAQCVWPVQSKKPGLQVVPYMQLHRHMATCTLE